MKKKNKTNNHYSRHYSIRMNCIFIFNSRETKLNAARNICVSFQPISNWNKTVSFSAITLLPFFIAERKSEWVHFIAATNFIVEFYVNRKFKMVSPFHSKSHFDCNPNEIIKIKRKKYIFLAILFYRLFLSHSHSYSLSLYVFFFVWLQY